MRVEFANAKLQKMCESEKELRRAYGKDCAKKVMTRLADLRAAPALADMRNLPGRCHELAGNRAGQLGIVLVGGRRLVLEPSDGWPEAKQEGADAWTEVDAVCVLEIVDYHDG
jgi:proteic killer suppression protein